MMDFLITLNLQRVIKKKKIYDNINYCWQLCATLSHTEKLHARVPESKTLINITDDLCFLVVSGTLNHLPSHAQSKAEH